MNKKLRFAVSEGGRKHEYLCGLLAADGAEAFTASESDAADADFFIAPRARDKNALLSRGIGVIEYAAREDFKSPNGVLTAQCAMCEAMLAAERSISGACCLVVGGGCIARPLAMYLNALGAQVTLAARRRDVRDYMSALGFDVMDIQGTHGDFELVFNTVPAQVVGAQLLSSLAPGAAVIDLASAPGGTDLEAARALGVAVFPALALPGKYMPRTAAEVIRNSVMSALKEMIL